MRKVSLPLFLAALVLAPSAHANGPCSQLILTQDGYSLSKWLGGTYNPVMPRCQKLRAEAAHSDEQCLRLIREAKVALRESNPWRINVAEKNHCARLASFLTEMGESQ